MQTENVLLLLMSFSLFFIGSVLIVSLVRFMYYREWSKESYIFVGGDKRIKYDCVYVENHLWHHEVKVSGLIVYLPKTVPHILLDLRSDDHSKDIGITPKKEGQLLQLEGDFTSMYDCFTPANSQSEAREILTPDAMEVLMRHEKVENIELYKNQLLLITNMHVKNNAEAQRCLNEFAEDITKELHHKFKSYKQAASTDEIQFVSAGTIKLGSSYISSVRLAFDIFSTLVTLPFIIVGISFLQTEPIRGLALLSGAVVFGLLCSLIFRTIYKYTTPR